MQYLKLSLHSVLCTHIISSSYRSNRFVFVSLGSLHSGALALRTERQSAQMSKIKNGGLDQYGAGSFEREQFGTAVVEGVNRNYVQLFEWL